MILIRFLLIGIIIYLIVRSFARLGEGSTRETHNPEPETKSKKVTKGVPKELGEYIDYEEVDK
jgi:hypothetical protein